MLFSFPLAFWVLSWCCFEHEEHPSLNSQACWIVTCWVLSWCEALSFYFGCHFPQVLYENHICCFIPLAAAREAGAVSGTPLNHVWLLLWYLKKWVIVHLNQYLVKVRLSLVKIFFSLLEPKLKALDHVENQIEFMIELLCRSWK